MECDRSVETTLVLLTNGAYAVFFASHILHTLLTYRYRVTNQPTPGFLTNTTTPPQAVFGHIARAAASEDHSRALRASTDRLPVDWRRPRGRDLVSSGFEQSRVISNRSTLDFTLHCGEQRIVLPDDVSWKRLCSSSVPPDDDDDDETAVGDIHQPFFYRPFDI